MDYRIHGNTIFIKGNGIYSHYMVHGDKMSKVVDIDGDDVIEHFHTIGDLPLNSEAKLVNELREQGKI